MQFTVRAIAFATFWIGVSLAAFGFARSGIVPSIFFVLAVLSLCGAVYALFKNSPTNATSVDVKVTMTAIVAWNLAILPTILVYPNTVGQLLRMTYEALFGDIQASYGTFLRIATFVGDVVVTLPATFVAVWLFDKLSRRSLRWRRAAISISIWEFLVVLVLVSSYEIGFSYSLNQVGWAILGPLDNVYSFSNLVLHRIIAWLIETTPVSWTALWLHSKLP